MLVVALAAQWRVLVVRPHFIGASFLGEAPITKAACPTTTVHTGTNERLLVGETQDLQLMAELLHGYKATREAGVTTGCAALLEPGCGASTPNEGRLDLDAHT